jgi:hypothetical protein
LDQLAADDLAELLEPPRGRWLAHARSSLGTGIIEALATHLGSSIQVIASNPGVAVTISHDRELDHPRDATAA